MESAAPPLTDDESVDRLAADLRACGYDAAHVPALLGRDAHRSLGRGFTLPALHATARASAGGSALATVVRLFLLGTGERVGDVAAALPSLGVDGGLACGALERDGDGRVRAGVDIRPHADEFRSYLVVSDFDSSARPGPVRADHVLGIGSASLTLARAVIRTPVRTVLDVGTGCGIQALHCSGHADVVVATDTNPRALALAAATARLNDMSWDLRHGSLFDPVAGERFDLVVSNPPFVISPGLHGFAYRDSGLVGDELCRRLVTGVAAHLTPGGTAHLLANWEIRDGGDWRQRVGAWVAGTGCDGWVVQRDVATPGDYVSLWLSDTGEAGADDAEGRAGPWLDYFAAESITGIGMGTITLRAPDRARGGTPDVVFDELTAAGEALTGAEVEGFLARRAYLAETSDDELLGERLALTAGALLEQRLLPGPDGWTPVLRMLYRPGGPGATVQLDEWGQALLAGCTGTVPLRLQLELLAAAHGLDRPALEAAVLPLLRTAITRGIVCPAGLAGGQVHDRGGVGSG